MPTPPQPVSPEAPTTPAICPYLFHVVADRLWTTPRSVYCRRPDGRTRLPGRATVDTVCATHAHLLCPGYLAGWADEQLARQPRGSPRAPGTQRAQEDPDTPRRR